MKTKKLNSDAYKFIEMAWDNMKLTSYLGINTAMYNTVKLSIQCQMLFDKEDFNKIIKSFRGGYWFGVNTNGKGFGSGFYIEAKRHNNPSALQSYEYFEDLKPFIYENKRIVHCDYLQDSDYIYEVTGFNKNKEITLVAYKKETYPGKYQRAEEKGKRKLFKFNNKDWLIFRKTINVY